MSLVSSPGAVSAPAWDAGLGQVRSLSSFTNPLYRGADPWVIRHGAWYYTCQAGPRGRLEIGRSHTLTNRGEPRLVWTPPRYGWNRAQVWAPELHFIRGRWYLYYSASDGYNGNHRMGVLEAATDDPQGPYIDRGMLYTGDDLKRWKRNRWAIDGTVLDLDGRLYFIWSGWEDHRDVQHLYIAGMSDPCTIGTDRFRVCANDCHPWERVGERHGERGLHEAPQILVHRDKVLLIYSCSGSWQPTYKLGMLVMDRHGDPLLSSSWKKHTAPVFQSTREIFGVGHCCFTQSPDGREDWLLYHSKTRRWDGWHDRVVRAQRFTWREDGLPDFGRPVDGPMPRPSGEHQFVAPALSLDARPVESTCSAA